MYPFEHKERALIALHGNWGNAVLVTFLAALMGGLVTATGFSFNLNLDEHDLAALPDFVIPLLTLVLSLAAGGGLVHFILGGPVRLGYSRYLLKLHDGAPAETGDLFSQFHNFGKGFVLNLLTNLYISLWSLLFIIPGIIAAYRYSMAPFIMSEHPEMTPSQALKASSELMNGYKWDLFCLGLSFIGWAILNVFTLGIGSLWLNPYMNAAYAAFYRRVTREKWTTPAGYAYTQSGY